MCSAHYSNFVIHKRCLNWSSVASWKYDRYSQENIFESSSSYKGYLKIKHDKAGDWKSRCIQQHKLGGISVNGERRNEKSHITSNLIKYDH